MSRRLVLALDQQCRLAGLPVPTPEFRFHPTRRWRFDFAYPDRSIGIEVEGAVYAQGRHTRGVGYENDCRKYAEALLRGWTVLRVTTGMVQSGEALGYLQQLLQR